MLSGPSATEIGSEAFSDEHITTGPAHRIHSLLG